VEVMALLKGADSVELKASVPADDHRRTVANLPLDPVEAQAREVFFFDTPDLELDAAGVIVRARRIQGGRGDTIVKRPVVPDQLPADVRRSASFRVEVDVVPGGFVCFGSCKGKSNGQEIQDVVAGAMPLSKLLSKEQLAFYGACPPGGIDPDTLVPLGPTFVLKARFTPEPDSHGPHERPMVAELWFLPDGSRILELSTRCPPSEAFQVAAETRAYPAEKGVDLGAAQEAKTRATLSWYRDALMGEQAPAQRPAVGA